MRLKIDSPLWLFPDCLLIIDGIWKDLKTMAEYTTALSLVSIQSPRELAAYIRNFEGPVCFGEARFELSYAMTASQLESMRTLLDGRVVSVHAACPKTESFPNLASSDPSVLSQSLQDFHMSLHTAVRFGATVLVLHPGYATDSPVPSDNLQREILLAGDEFKPFVWFKKGSICKNDYVSEPVYRHFINQAIFRLAAVAKECRENGVKLAVENLNPEVGYLFQTPNEMVEVANSHPDIHLCLDVGHLWLSSCVYGFDFLDGVRTIIGTGKVVTSHLHSNSSHPASSGYGGGSSGRYEDDHASFDRWGFPTEALVGLLTEAGANLVIETKESPLHNARLLQNLVRGLDA